MNNGMIPQTVIDEVLRRYEIGETVGKYVSLTRNGKYLKGLCPFHSEKTPSFTVTPEKQIFHCYGCGKSGNVIKFLMEIESESFPETVTKLAREADIPIGWTGSAPDEQSPRQREKAKLHEAHEFGAKLYNYLLLNIEAAEAAREYLRSRGFDDEMIRHFQIGYAPDRWDTLKQGLERRGFELSEMETGGLLSRRQDSEHYIDRFRDRIMFPIHDGSGHPIAFGGRLLSDGQPKYLNTPESPLFAKSRTLYRLHDAKSAIRRTRQAVLFEGYVDCIKAWSAGVLNGVATMGTALTAEHAAMLKRYADEIVLCYDGDDAGQAAAHKSILLLEESGFRVRIGLLPGRMDPDEYIQAHGAVAFKREIIEGAVSAVKFQLIYLRKTHILLEEDGKIRYLRDAVRIVARRDSPTERELLLQELSKEFAVSLDSLKQECLEVRQKEKLSGGGDIPGGSWNNVGNDKKSVSRTPRVLPDYVQAERLLISWMMLDKEVALLVQSRLGDQFQVEDHAALAAYLYAYYAQYNDPDVGRFVTFLQDDRLERAAGAIALIDVPFGERELEDCIRTIGRALLAKEQERLTEALNQAQRKGDTSLATKFLLEIVALEKKRKGS